MDRPVKQPGPDHPITISSEDTRVCVEAGGQAIADTARAVVLREHVYPDVFYVARADVPARVLERSDHTSWCPYKGEANYFHLVLDDGTRLENAVWTYETPADAVAAIKDRLAFYPDRVSVTAR